jgi:hypothetical protein
VKRIRIQLIFSLVGLVVIVVCAGCETTKIKAPEPLAESEPAQPVVTEPTVEPTPDPPPPPPPPRTPSPKVKLPEGPHFVHTVKWQGESLSTIAAWYTGTIRNGRALGDVNPQLADPNRIAVGTKVRILQKMLRTREAMPQGFAESYVKPPKQSGVGAADKPIDTSPTRPLSPVAPDG